MVGDDRCGSWSCVPWVLKGKVGWSSHTVQHPHQSQSCPHSPNPDQTQFDSAHSPSSVNLARWVCSPHRQDQSGISTFTVSHSARWRLLGLRTCNDSLTSARCLHKFSSWIYRTHIGWHKRKTCTVSKAVAHSGQTVDGIPTGSHLWLPYVPSFQRDSFVSTMKKHSYNTHFFAECAMCLKFPCVLLQHHGTCAKTKQSGCQISTSTETLEMGIFSEGSLLAGQAIALHRWFSSFVSSITWKIVLTWKSPLSRCAWQLTKYWIHPWWHQFLVMSLFESKEQLQLICKQGTPLFKDTRETKCHWCCLTRFTWLPAILWANRARSRQTKRLLNWIARWVGEVQDLNSSCMSKNCCFGHCLVLQKSEEIDPEGTKQPPTSAWNCLGILPTHSLWCTLHRTIREPCSYSSPICKMPLDNNLKTANWHTKTNMKMLWNFEAAQKCATLDRLVKLWEQDSHRNTKISLFWQAKKVGKFLCRAQRNEEISKAHLPRYSSTRRSLSRIQSIETRKCHHVELFCPVLVSFTIVIVWQKKESMEESWDTVRTWSLHFLMATDWDWTQGIARQPSKAHTSKSTHNLDANETWKRNKSDYWIVFCL